MKINKRLNLVLQVGDDESTIHVHHTPIMQEIFERHAQFLAKAMNAMYADNLHPIVASRIAYIVMRDITREENRYKTVERTFFPELWRMTNCVVPAKAGGFETVPFQEIINSNLMEPDDILEVQNFLCFFTVVSWLHGAPERAALYEVLTGSGMLTTSLDVTEYKNSLATLKPGENTGETAKASSIPS